VAARSNTCTAQTYSASIRPSLNQPGQSPRLKWGAHLAQTTRTRIVALHDVLDHIRGDGDRRDDGGLPA